MRSHIPKSPCSILRHTVLVLAGAGCSSGLDGPTPSLSQRDPLAISPALVCSQQLSTTLEISGQHFSPVPADVPSKARLLLPTFMLERSTLLDGSKASRTTLVYSGDPKQSENVAALRWLSETHMQATLDDQRVIDGRRGQLPAGVYDARVVNPNGHESAAAAALVVVDKPSFAAQAELLLCESRAEQTLVIEGSGFLRIADALPALQIDGHGDALSISELTECDTLELAQSDAAICSRAQLTVSNQLPVGSYEAKLANPEPAACHSDEKLSIRVVAGPQLESNPIENLCMRGQIRALIVRGKGFQDSDGTLPSATLGGQAATVVALADCEPETGAMRSCKKLQIELPTGNLAATAGATTLTVTNPAPASCSVSANVQLRELVQKEGPSLKPCLER